MQNETQLRGLAHQQLVSGQLPNVASRRVWGGPGLGIACSMCELPVRTDETEMRVRFTRDHIPVFEALHLHARCFAAWELERTN